jgi:putative aldouronate transport system substrate-binding protein
MPNYNSRLQDEDVKRYVTTDDGRVFGAIGMYKSGSSVPSTGPVIRADWLEELGLEKPVTYDEYHDVLTAFKNAHPDMSTPIFISPHGGCNANYLSAGYGVATNTILGSSIFIIVDGQVQYSPMLPGYKDYLTMMNQWYTEGLLDHDFYSREENGGNIDPSIITTGNVGIFLTNVSNISAFEEVAKEEDPDFRIEPIRDARLTEDSETHLMSLTSKAEGLTFLSGTVEKEKVETLLRYMDYLYSEEGSLLANYGIEGESYTMVDGVPTFTDVVLHNADGMAITNAMGLYGFGMFGPFVMEDYERKSQYVDASYFETWQENSDNSYYWNSKMYVFNEEESTVYNQYAADIATYLSEAQVGFIIGDRSLDEWESFVDQINNMGLQECLDALQSAYDRYMSK